MGGQLLKGRRVSREEYHSLIQELDETVFKVTPFSVPYSLPDKEDFGDIDIIVETEHKNSLIEYAKHLNVEFISQGGDLHFLYKGVQVDIMFCKAGLRNYTQKYYSYGDLNNLLGRTLKNAFPNLSYTSEGLKVKIPTPYGKRIQTISTDWRDIYRLLKLDYSYGFESEEDMFEFVCSSPFFSREYYLLENLSNEHRTRDSKRPQYMRFLKFIEEHPFKWLEELFPIALEFEFQVQEEVNKKIELSKKFNGKIVSSLTGRTGKDLGDLMKVLNVTNDMSEEEIRELVLTTHKALL